MGAGSRGVTLEQATIRVVDDEPILRLTFALVLKQRGATVYSAADGAEAIALLTTHRVDVMLTDKQMPGMDGNTLLRTLHERGMAVPSILFVNPAGAEDFLQMQRWGVVETVTKPLHPNDLLAVFQRVLQPLEAAATGVRN